MTEQQARTLFHLDALAERQRQLGEKVFRRMKGCDYSTGYKDAMRDAWEDIEALKAMFKDRFEGGDA